MTVFPADDAPRIFEGPRWIESTDDICKILGLQLPDVPCEELFSYHTSSWIVWRKIWEARHDGRSFSLMEKAAMLETMSIAARF